MNQYRQKWRDIYHKRLQTIGYEADPAQLAVIDELARIEQALSQTAAHTPKKSGFLSRWLASRPAETEIVKGLYLFGTVGRGKTFLMDLFCQHVEHRVIRLHFHHFMKDIHDRLGAIKDQENPLAVIADDFAQNYRIVCLDEFMVTDITDAMLLYGFLKDLTDKGVVIVTTTNILPDDLYKGGLQRERFLPAIALIKQRLVIHEMGGGVDFRRLCLERHQRFFSPLSQTVSDELVSITHELSANFPIARDGAITVNDREIPFIARSEEVIWFDFAALCEGYRSQLDYIELAKEFPVFIVSNIPVLDQFKEDAAKRFLLLVDELYDRRINLILSSEVPIESIYTGKRIAFEFDRLQSRLFEMQAMDYGKAVEHSVS